MSVSLLEGRFARHFNFVQANHGTMSCLIAKNEEVLSSAASQIERLPAESRAGECQQQKR